MLATKTCKRMRRHTYALPPAEQAVDRQQPDTVWEAVRENATLNPPQAHKDAQAACGLGADSYFDFWTLLTACSDEESDVDSIPCAQMVLSTIRPSACA